MKRSILLVLACFIGFNSFGWGVTGHRVTGWIAEYFLSAKAKKKVSAILNNESLAMVSTWMDEIRSDSTYNHTGDWHWVTIETGKTYDESPKNLNGDVIMALERIIADLKSHKLDRNKEIEALKMLVHLVGDIHQPLHVGCCDDQGGNKVKVKWFRGESNLHRVWDSEMIDDTKLSFTELAQSLGKPDKTMVAQWQKASVRDWAYESMTYRKEVYDIKDGNLSYRYGYLHFASAKQRMLQAGVRLAGILNQIYG
jgi:S1/P1 Nuclease